MTDLDLDQIEERYNDWYGRGYDNEPLTHNKQTAELYPYADYGDETRSHYIVRNDVPALVAEAARVCEALQAVRDLHVAGRCGCDPNSPHSTGHCRVCGIKAGWPCATVRALDAALDGAE